MNFPTTGDTNFPVTRRARITPGKFRVRNRRFRPCFRVSVLPPTFTNQEMNFPVTVGNKFPIYTTLRLRNVLFTLNPTPMPSNAPRMTVTRMTEADLIAGCRANRPEAQREVYDRYKDAMYTLAYRLTGDFDEANDVLQDAFIKVFKHIHSFREESTLGAWIKTITVRTGYSKLRKKKVHFEDLDQVPDNQVLDWGEYLQTDYLERAILGLPEGYRTVFTLVEIEGYGHKEIAKMLGISEGTSKSQLYYAKRRLREMLTQGGHGRHTS